MSHKGLEKLIYRNTKMVENGECVSDIINNEGEAWGKLPPEDKLRVLAALYLNNDWFDLYQTMEADWEEEVINSIKELLQLDNSQILESEGLLEEYRAGRK